MSRLAPNADTSKSMMSSTEISRKKMEDLLVVNNANSSAALITGKKIAMSGAVIIKAIQKLIKIALSSAALIILKKSSSMNKIDALLKNKPSLHGLNQKQCRLNSSALLNTGNGSLKPLMQLMK